LGCRSIERHIDAACQESCRTDPAAISHFFEQRAKGDGDMADFERRWQTFRFSCAELEQPDQYRATMTIAAIRNTAIKERARSKALERGSGLGAPSGGMKQIPCTHLLPRPAFLAKINPALSTVETTRTNPPAEFNWTSSLEKERN
jgi:hypothetical protein